MGIKNGMMQILYEYYLLQLQAIVQVLVAYIDTHSALHPNFVHIPIKCEIERPSTLNTFQRALDEFRELIFS